MARRTNFLDTDDNFREQNLRFVRNDLEDNINQYFGGSGGIGRNNVAPPPRDFKIVQPKPGNAEFENRKDFFLQLGLNRGEANSLANRSFCLEQLNINFFRERRNNLRKMAINHKDIDMKIVSKIRGEINAVESQRQFSGGFGGGNDGSRGGDNFQQGSGTQQKTPNPPRNINWNNRKRGANTNLGDDYDNGPQSFRNDRNINPGDFQRNNNSYDVGKVFNRRNDFEQPQLSTNFNSMGSMNANQSMASGFDSFIASGGSSGRTNYNQNDDRDFNRGGYGNFNANTPNNRDGEFNRSGNFSQNFDSDLSRRDRNFGQNMLRNNSSFGNGGDNATGGSFNTTNFGQNMGNFDAFSRRSDQLNLSNRSQNNDFGRNSSSKNLTSMLSNFSNSGNFNPSATQLQSGNLTSQNRNALSNFGGFNRNKPQSQNVSGGSFGGVDSSNQGGGDFKQNFTGPIKNEPSSFGMMGNQTGIKNDFISPKKEPNISGMMGSNQNTPNVGRNFGNNGNNRGGNNTGNVPRGNNTGNTPRGGNGNAGNAVRGGNSGAVRVGSNAAMRGNNNAGNVVRGGTNNTGNAVRGGNNNVGSTLCGGNIKAGSGVRVDNNAGKQVRGANSSGNPQNQQLPRNASNRSGANSNNSSNNKPGTSNATATRTQNQSQATNIAGSNANLNKQTKPTGRATAVRRGKSVSNNAVKKIATTRRGGGMVMKPQVNPDRNINLQHGHNRRNMKASNFNSNLNQGANFNNEVGGGFNFNNGPNSMGNFPDVDPNSGYGYQGGNYQDNGTVNEFIGLLTTLVAVSNMQNNGQGMPQQNLVKKPVPKIDLSALIPKPIDKRVLTFFRLTKKYRLPQPLKESYAVKSLIKKMPQFVDDDYITSMGEALANNNLPDDPEDDGITANTNEVDTDMADPVDDGDDLVEAEPGSDADEDIESDKNNDADDEDKKSTIDDPFPMKLIRRKRMWKPKKNEELNKYWLKWWQQFKPIEAKVLEKLKECDNFNLNERVGLLKATRKHKFSRVVKDRVIFAVQMLKTFNSQPIVIGKYLCLLRDPGFWRCLSRRETAQLLLTIHTVRNLKWENMLRVFVLTWVYYQELIEYESQHQNKPDALKNINTAKAAFKNGLFHLFVLQAFEELKIISAKEWPSYKTTYPTI